MNSCVYYSVFVKQESQHTSINGGVAKNITAVETGLLVLCFTTQLRVIGTRVHNNSGLLYYQLFIGTS